MTTTGSARGDQRANMRRYLARQRVEDDFWSVVDIFTGWPANYIGIVLDCLPPADAERLADILNCADILRRERSRGPQ
ncbi:hypothetical protein CO663_32310 [Rhizobium anhuiense]|nr:hypothetical protein CO663_32310 [Rhizobium anhuiense]